MELFVDGKDEFVCDVPGLLCLTAGMRFTLARASYISASEWRSNGSKLDLMVPEKRKGCLIVVC